MDDKMFIVEYISKNGIVIRKYIMASSELEAKTLAFIRFGIRYTEMSHVSKYRKPNKYTWKDIVFTDAGVIEAEFPITGKKDSSGRFYIGDFLSYVDKFYLSEYDDIGDIRLASEEMDAGIIHLLSKMRGVDSNIDLKLSIDDIGAYCNGKHIDGSSDCGHGYEDDLYTNARKRKPRLKNTTQYIFRFKVGNGKIQEAIINETSVTNAWLALLSLLNICADVEHNIYVFSMKRKVD